jgi:hypothetical protein
MFYAKSCPLPLNKFCYAHTHIFEDTQDLNEMLPVVSEFKFTTKFLSINTEINEMLKLFILANCNWLTAESHHYKIIFHKQ